MIHVAAVEAVLTVLLAACLGGCADQSNSPSLLLVSSGSSGDTASHSAASTERVRPAIQDTSVVLFVAYVATPQDIVDEMLKMARVTRHDVVCDLGCGDGRIVVAAAKRYRCRAIGYDLDRLRVQEARRNARDNRVAHLVTIRQEDILKADLRDATVVTLYMGNEMNAKLIPQLRALRPGTRIVSHDFGIGEIPPDETVEMDSSEDNRKHKIYLWTCPLL